MGGQGAGQSLVSAGSCLKEFRPRPFIECHGHGRCNYHTTALSYWLATIEEYAMFQKPRQQTIKAGLDLTSRVSRCSVCIRRRTIVGTATPPPAEYNRIPTRRPPYNVRRPQTPNTPWWSRPRQRTSGRQ